MDYPDLLTLACEQAPQPLSCTEPAGPGTGGSSVEAAVLAWLWRRHARVADTPARLMVALRDGALPELCVATLRPHLERLKADTGSNVVLRLRDPLGLLAPAADIVIGPQYALLDSLPKAEATRAQWLIDAPSVPAARRACQNLAGAFAAGRVRVLPPPVLNVDALLDSTVLHAAASLLVAHRPGTTTLAVPATLAKARLLMRELQQLGADVPLVAVHPCFRTAHRTALAASLLTVPPTGRILVATPEVAAQLHADRIHAAGDGSEPPGASGTDSPVLNVLWRYAETGADAPPQADELCPVPVSAVRRLRRARWLWDRASARWLACTAHTPLPPGTILRLNAEEGGYDAALGWMPHAKQPVVPALASG